MTYNLTRDNSKYLRSLNNKGISDQYTNSNKSKDSNYKKITLKLAKSKFTKSPIKTNHKTTFKTKPDKTENPMQFMWKQLYRPCIT